MNDVVATKRDWAQPLDGEGILHAADAADHRAITWLLSMSRQSYQGHLRQSILGLLHEQPSFVLERGGKLRCVVLCALYRHPVAMLEAVAARGKREVDTLCGEMLDRVEGWLVEAGVRWLGVAGPPDWLAARLASRGYGLQDQVVSLTKVGFDAPPGSKDVRIRNAEVDDLPAVLQVDRAAFEPFWRMNAPGLQEFLASSGCFLVAEQGSEIIGYISVDVWQEWAHVNRVAVLPMYQGRRIGMRLMHDGLAQVSSPMRRGVRLNTQTDNQRSLRMYARLGFVEAGAPEPYMAKQLGCTS